MATGGFEVESEKTRLMEKTDDQDDGDASPGGEQTTKFEPGASSTPAPNGNQRQTTFNRPGEQPSFVDISNAPDPPGTSPEKTKFTKERLLMYYKKFDQDELTYELRTKSERIFVAMMSKKTFYPLLTRIGDTDEYRINKALPKEILRALGKGEMEILEEEIKNLIAGIKANKEIAENPNEIKIERKKALERSERQNAELIDKKRHLDKLKKRKFFTPPSESIELETFQKNAEERDKKIEKLQSEKEQQEIIKNDENSSPAQKEMAVERINEIVSEENEIENEQEREIEQLPLRDRLREKVKAIFKKYGFTVGAVFLAVGTTLGVVLSSLSNGLKTVSKGVGNGLKTLGKKIAPILPGIIGAVVSFVLRTAGNVVGFLGKHAWLLILAVAAFLFDSVMKRRG